MGAAIIAVLCFALSGAAQCTNDESRLETVRSQLAGQYARIETANKNRDVAALLALRAPNCSANGPGGTRSNCVDMDNYTKQLIAGNKLQRRKSLQTRSLRCVSTATLQLLPLPSIS